MFRIYTIRSDIAAAPALLSRDHDNENFMLWCYVMLWLFLIWPQRGVSMSFPNFGLS